MFTKHENATEKFYGVGVEKFNGYHNNYLNFGLWENNITDYVKASENLLSRVANRINLNEQSVLLDVACGMGTQDSFFMNTFKCFSIEGLDLTTKHIELAKKYNDHPKIKFTRGNACHLPYDNEFFTHVIGIEGPANFNTRQKFMLEAFRVLKPGGYLGLSDYSLARKPKNWLERQLIKQTVKFWHMPFENVQTNDEFAQTLKDCGFTNVSIEVVTKSVIPGYIAENRKPENRKEIYRIRGPIWGRLSDYLDDFVEWLYKRDLVDYILVSAQKPKALDEIILEKILDIFQYPHKLLGLREPPIDALWGYVTGLRHAMELDSDKNWSTFLQSKNFGARTEYSMLEKYPTFESKIRFLQDLHIAYSQFLRKK